MVEYGLGEVGAVDDVSGECIPVELVKEARKEEVGLMKKRNLL